MNTVKLQLRSRGLCVDAWIKKRTIPGFFFFSRQSDPLKTRHLQTGLCLRNAGCECNIWWMTVCIQEDVKLLQTVKNKQKKNPTPLHLLRQPHFQIFPLYTCWVCWILLLVRKDSQSVRSLATYSAAEVDGTDGQTVADQTRTGGTTLKNDTIHNENSCHNK